MPTKQSALHLPLAPQHLGLEASVTRDDHQSLRLWLRMMSCTNQVNAEIRRRLRAEFGMSIARFDYLAQVHRYPDGLTMTKMSSLLMVTGGNVTGLTQELEKDGWIVRETDPADRRSSRVRFTPTGRETFERIASVHEAWVVSMFSGLKASDRTQLSQLLGQLRLMVAQSEAAAEEPAAAPRPRRPRAVKA